MDIRKSLSESAQSPQDLDDDDLTELFKILQLAIQAHSTDHYVTAPMLDAFSQAIFENRDTWSYFEGPPEPPKKLPYRDDGDCFDDDYTYEFEYDIMTAEDGEWIAVCLNSTGFVVGKQALMSEPQRGTLT